MSGQPPYLTAAQYPYSRDIRYSGCSNPDPAMGYNRRPSMLGNYHQYSSTDRVSMHPYYLQIPPEAMGPHIDENSKHHRFPTMNSHLNPMSRDVKTEQPLYQPTTEAISPIHDDAKFDTHLRDTTIIRSSISKLDSDIDLTLKKLQRAQLSQNEIRRQADTTAVDDEETEDTTQVNESQTLIEKILHDNRKRAEDSQRVLNQFNHNMDLSIPLYQEPNDLELIGMIRRQYMNIMKNHLIHFFKKSRDRYLSRTKFDSDRYDEAYQRWQQSIEKEEKAILAKDTSTYREIFERTFSELRKAREDKEKKQINQSANDNGSSSSSLSSIDSSAAQQLSLSNNINHEQEMEEDEEKMRKSSVVPPIILDCWQRKHQFFNENGLVKDDALLFYKDEAKLPYWSPEERQIFIEKFTQSPKNFGYIASFLANKTTEQCVQFYYMTKKGENYKNLLRKQAQNTRRRTKHNTTTTLTTTTVTSSTTIETTLVTKFSSNTIFSSTSQKILGSTSGSGQDNERSSERIENDEERRDHNLNDGNEEKRINKKCSFLSCTSGRKKNRKSRLRAFPSQWNELTDENREEIRRNLQIPPNVQRCCIRCYEKLIEQVCQRQTNDALEEDDDDDDDVDDEENNEPIVSSQTSSKFEKDEWANADVDAFKKTVEKYNFNWEEIANHFQRSKQSCKTFYRLNQQVSYPDDAVDEDNGSISDSDQLGTMKPKTSDERAKLNINEDSNDSIHPMIIDEGEDNRSVQEDTSAKITHPSPIVSNSNLTTINSLVEKEISKTLHETEKRTVPDSAHSEPSISAEKSTSYRPPPNSIIPTVTGATPPALVIPVRAHSPTNTYYAHSSQTSTSSAKGSIMRGTPILSSVGAHKSIPIDPIMNQNHQHSSSRTESNNLKSPKMLDRNLEQHIPHSQQQQQQHNAYMRQHPTQSHMPTMHPQSHKSSANKVDLGNPNRLERLRADYVTSKYLTNPSAPHSSGHEHSHRSNIHESRGSRQGSPPLNQHLHQSQSNPSIHASMHSHHGLNTGNFLSPNQLFATSGMYPHDSLPNPALSYSQYYGPLLPATQVLFNPHVMQDYASVAAANNEQYKSRSMRPHHPHHSTADPATYSSHLPSRHPHDEMGYTNPDYVTSAWRTTNMNNNNLNKTGHGSNENPMLKLVDASRHSAMRLPASNDMDRRSPDDSHSTHHRLQLSRSTIDMPSVHFPRAEVHNHHKPPHDKANPHSHYLDHSTDPNALAYMRESVHIAKPQPKHHSSHHLPPTANAPSRTIIAPSSSSMPGSQQGAYVMHGFPHSTAMGAVSPHRQHHQAPGGHHPHPQHHYSPSSRNSYPYESTKNPKDLMSIQEYMSKTVDDFVRSSNQDPKHTHKDQHPHESSTNSSSNRNHQANNCDQLILIDGDDDLNTPEHSEAEGNPRNLNKSNNEMEMFGRRRVSSIKKILSNQALDKHQYDDITQQMQNSINNSNTSKPSSNADQSGIERSNSIGGRTRSRGSITMRMLMGEQEAYADGKAQSKTSSEETSNKRSLSSDGNCEKIEYLIRDELVRSRPAMSKGSESPSVFSRQPSNQQFMPPSKRMKAWTREDEQRTSSSHSTQDSPGPSRDPFVLQSQSKSSHQSFQSSANAEKHWQTLAQQQYHSSPLLNSRSSRPTGSITQGSPISSSIRLSTDQSSYSLAANNQLINPRYSHYMNKNDQPYSISRQSSPSPHDHSSRQKIPRRSHQITPPSSESVQQSHTLVVESSSTAKSPSRTHAINNVTPPTTSTIGGHSLKKRLITEYELEQQRNSPIPIATSSPSRTDTVEGTVTRSTATNNQKCEVDVESKSDLREENVTESVNDSVSST